MEGTLAPRDIVNQTYFKSYFFSLNLMQRLILSVCIKNLLSLPPQSKSEGRDLLINFEKWPSQ
jgi:hypothetical protein